MVRACVGVLSAGSAAGGDRGGTRWRRRRSARETAGGRGRADEGRRWGRSYGCRGSRCRCNAATTRLIHRSGSCRCFDVPRPFPGRCGRCTARPARRASCRRRGAPAPRKSSNWPVRSYTRCSSRRPCRPRLPELTIASGSRDKLLRRSAGGSGSPKISPRMSSPALIAPHCPWPRMPPLRRAW